MQLAFEREYHAIPADALPVAGDYLNAGQLAEVEQKRAPLYAQYASAGVSGGLVQSRAAIWTRIENRRARFDHRIRRPAERLYARALAWAQRNRYTTGPTTTCPA